MKKIFYKLNKLEIQSKLFLITSSLLICLALLIYSILYFSLPKFYEVYKSKNLITLVSQLETNSKDLNSDDLIEYVHYFSLDNNLIINLYDYNGNLVYGKHPFRHTIKEHTFNRAGDNKFQINKVLLSKDGNTSYVANIAMPLQPINEASIVLRKLLPSIILLTLLISFIGAYMYSICITKPLMDIIDMGREQENKRKQFIATISHELKTPITIILGQLEGMIYNIGKYKDRDTYLRKTHDSTIELKELVTEMMEISKADMIEDTLVYSTFDINALVGELVKRQNFLLEDKSLNLKTSLNSKKLINGDKDKLSRAINNVLNNAIKYSPANESINICTKDYSGGTLLTIENTGVTIPKKYISHLFNPFFRVEPSRNRKTGGTGLGLYITSQILKAHNYRFDIYNNSNSVIFKIFIKNIKKNF